jgi:hypothetical protein
MALGSTRQSIDIEINLFEKNFGKKINKIASDLNKNISQIQNTASNFNLTTDALNQTQKQFGLNLTKTGKSLRTMGGGLLSNSNALNKYIAQNAGMFDMFRMNDEQFKNFNRSGAKLNHTSAKMANSFRKGTQGLKGFRMEFLSVMFLGMFIQRVFTGLLKTSMEWVGVTEVMSTALGILFLPVAMLLLDWALMFLDWVGQLSDNEKRLIGTFVLAAIAVGGLLFVIGTLILGIGGLIAAFGFILSPLGLFVAGLTALIGFSVLRGLFQDLTDDTSNLNMKLNNFGVSDEMINGMIDKFTELAEVMMEKLGIALDWIKRKMKETVDDLLNKTDDWVEIGETSMSKWLEGVRRFAENHPQAIAFAIIGFMLGGPFGATIGAAFGFAGTDAILNFVDGLANWIVDNTGELVYLGITIALKIAKGLVLGLAKMGVGIIGGLLGIDVDENLKEIDRLNQNIQFGSGSLAEKMLRNNKKIEDGTKSNYNQMSLAANQSFLNQEISSGNAFMSMESTQSSAVMDMQNNWSKMVNKNSSESAKMAGNINSALDSIPTEITTIHRIIEVKGSGGGGGGKLFAPKGATANEIAAQMSLLPQYRQHGGPVSPNRPYVVGEAGPELFVPGRGGNIVPNGGGIVVNYTINASGSNTKEFEMLIKENNSKLVSDLRRLIQD